MTYSSWGATLAAPYLMVAKGELVALAAIARAVVAVAVAGCKVRPSPGVLERVASENEAEVLECADSNTPRGTLVEGGEEKERRSGPGTREGKVKMLTAGQGGFR